MQPWQSQYRHLYGYVLCFVFRRRLRFELGLCNLFSRISTHTCLISQSWSRMSERQIKAIVLILQLLKRRNHGHSFRPQVSRRVQDPIGIFKGSKLLKNLDVPKYYISNSALQTANFFFTFS